MYRFGAFSLDLKRRSLTRDGTPIPLPGKAFDILVYFVQHPNQIVTKHDLMKAVWPDTNVEEGNLTQNLSLLRKALAEHGDEGQLIVTVARQGYQFTADVTSPPERDTRWRPVIVGTGVAVVLLIGASIAWQRFHAASRTEMIRLAVLPFENLTGDPSEDYLADGLTEEITTQLARLRPEQLGVIARTSVMQYKHAEKTMDQIGRDLSVGYALESSLRRSADRLRVTVQLIRVTDESHLWANDFDYTQQDVFHIEDSVAAAVAREVQLRLTPDQRARLVRQASTNTVAIDAVMRGRDLLLFPRDKASWVTAKRYFDQAIALDSGYALAWASLSAACRTGADRQYMPAEQGIREARQALARALALDPSLPEAWEQLGQMQRLVDWNWTEAEKSYQRALDLDPGNARVLSRASSISASLGRVDESLALSRRALELDPLNPITRLNLGVNYYYANRLDSAAAMLESLSPDRRNRLALVFLIEVYLAQGHVADAAHMLPQVTDSESWAFAAALVGARQGSRLADSALTILRQYSQEAYQVATVYAFRGEADSAFAWLNRAYAQRDQGLAEVKVDPLVRRIRGDPRYAAFLTKMRLPL